jgi:hypothetical protein
LWVRVESTNEKDRGEGRSVGNEQSNAPGFEVQLLLVVVILYLQSAEGEQEKHVK